jgi:DNA-binding MarR family transcriptional regulator
MDRQPGLCLKLALKGEQLKRITERFEGIKHESILIVTTLDRINRIAHDRFFRSLSEHGISEGRFYVLAYLTMEEIEGNTEVRPSDIAKNIGVTRATITGLLDGLERSGTVQRRQPSRDRRTQIVSLTAKGHEALSDITKLLGKDISPLYDVLSGAEFQGLMESFSKIEDYFSKLE